MKHNTGGVHRPNAFTLIETLVVLGATAIILGALMVGSTSLQRSFSATDDYSANLNTQLRILDYVAKDVRRAITATVDQDGVTVTTPATGNGLTVTVPGYSFSSGEPVAPSLINGGSTVNYQAAPVIIQYSTSGQSVLRTVDAAQTTIATIGNGTASLQLTFEDLGTSIKGTVSFAPKFRRTLSTDARQGTTMSLNAILRNARQ